MSERVACNTLLLVLILASAPQNAGWEVVMLCQTPSAVFPLDTSREPFLPSQATASLAPAPFGRYTENINGVLLQLVRMPQGAFLMGNDHSSNPEEKPAHEVHLRSFYIGQFEVTRQQWNVVVDTLPKVNRDLRKQYINDREGFKEMTPADIVSWDDAVEICDRLTKFTGKKYRLPSEAEWEYACRAGTNTEFSFGNEVNYNLAHFKNAADETPPFYLLPVGQKGYTNAWGLYDMHGNVAEWCLDVKHLNYINAPIDGSPWMQDGDQRERCQRGGMYNFRGEFGRSSARSFWPNDLRASGFGFRVVAETSLTIGNGRATVASAATYSTKEVAPEAIAALFGSNLSDGIQIASSTPLPISLAGASVILKDSRGNDYASPLFFVSPNQINFQIPQGVVPGTATIYAVNSGNIHSTGAIEITNISPGLFTADASGGGLAAAVVLRVKANGDQVYEPVGQLDLATGQFTARLIDVSNPAEQVFLLLYGTGFRHHSGLNKVRVTINGVSAEVLFAGAQGDFAGLDQCNVRLVPSLVGSGEISIALTADGKTSNTVKARIK